MEQDLPLFSDTIDLPCQKRVFFSGHSGSTDFSGKTP